MNRITCCPFRWRTNQRRGAMAAPVVVSVPFGCGGAGASCGWLEDDPAAKTALGEPPVRIGYLLERPDRGNSRGEAAGVGEGGEFGQPGGVGADPDVADADAAQGRRRGTGSDGDE